ncbi:Nif11-like leader peptide family natural product precursor [Scytonema sp. PCC 10023]|uniref:Nif11-like leader peptide family natural product precursor n=1 Tax=Scytonema sp. PCC 10023 TaxID=1680591 RepID=UPI0039C73C4F
MTTATLTKTNSDLELFYKEVLRDYSLQEQLKAATSPESLIKLSVKLAGERGYHFAIEEVLDAVNGNNTYEEVNLNTVMPTAIGSSFCIRLCWK